MARYWRNIFLPKMPICGTANRGQNTIQQFRMYRYFERKFFCYSIGNVEESGSFSSPFSSYNEHILGISEFINSSNEFHS